MKIDKEREIYATKIKEKRGSERQRKEGRQKRRKEGKKKGRKEIVYLAMHPIHFIYSDM